MARFVLIAHDSWLHFTFNKNRTCLQWGQRSPIFHCDIQARFECYRHYIDKSPSYEVWSELVWRMVQSSRFAMSMFLRQVDKWPHEILRILSPARNTSFAFGPSRADGGSRTHAMQLSAFSCTCTYVVCYAGVGGRKNDILWIELAKVNWQKRYASPRGPYWQIFSIHQ